MNYVEHHFGDYARDTAHLSLLEHGAYRLLLDLYYVREKALPADVKDCCRLVRAASSVERKAVQTVLSEFFELTPDGWAHKRCNAEIARYRDKQEKAKRSATARWNARPSQSDRNANADANADANAHADASPDAMRTHSEGNAHQTPDTRHQTPDSRHQTPDKGKEQRARGTRLLLSALPDEWREFCTAERVDLQADAVFARFADYWRSQPGQRGVRVDWLATWRNWVRNERAPTARAGGSPVSKQAALEARNRAAADEWLRTFGVIDASAAA